MFHVTIVLNEAIATENVEKVIDVKVVVVVRLMVEDEDNEKMVYFLDRIVKVLVDNDVLQIGILPSSIIIIGVIYQETGTNNLIVREVDYDLELIRKLILNNFKENVLLHHFCVVLMVVDSSFNLNYNIRDNLIINHII